MMAEIRSEEKTYLSNSNSQIYYVYVCTYECDGNNFMLVFLLDYYYEDKTLQEMLITLVDSHWATESTVL